MAPIHRFGFAILCLFAAAGAPADAEDSGDKVARGVALHDQGRYAEAIALYREVLRAEPDDATAQYELAFSLKAAGDHAECAKVGKRALEKAEIHRAELHAVAGNCLAAGGKPKDAIKAYEKGLKEFPDDSNLAFHFAMTQYGLERYREALQLAKRAIASRPGHTSAFALLARLYQLEGYSAHALLAALRYLTLDPISERGRPVVQLAHQLLTRSARQKDATNIEIAVTKEPKGEGDFSGVSLMVAMLAAQALTEGKDQPEGERRAQQIDRLLQFLAEDQALGDKSTFAGEHLVSPLVAIHRAKLGEAFGYLSLSALDLEGGQIWLAKHDPELTALLKLATGI